MADKQTCNQFFAQGQSLWNTGQTRSPPALPAEGGPKSQPHIFFVFTNLDWFDLGTSLKKLCFKPRQ